MSPTLIKQWQSKGASPFVQMWHAVWHPAKALCVHTISTLTACGIAYGFGHIYTQKAVQYITSHAISVLHWERANQHGCALRSSHTKEKSTSVVRLLVVPSKEACRWKCWHILYISRPACIAALGLLKLQYEAFQTHLKRGRGACWLPLLSKRP